MIESPTELNDRRFNRTDALYGLGLFLITVLSRIPFRSHILYHWDSVNFADGIRRFDMLQEHPQPPGYIVYVWLCRVVDLLFHDANTTMVWISVVTSGLAVVVLYLLGRTMWNRRVGLVAALFLASNPLVWFYGEIALPHILDTFLVLLALWLLYRVQQGERQFLWPAVIVLSVAGGIRQQTLVFLLPLALYAVWRVGWKRLLFAGLLGVVVCLIWFTPLIVSCGGLGAYQVKTATYFTRYQRSTSILMGAGWSGVARNLRKLGLYTLYGAGAALIPLGLYGAVRLRHWRRPERWDRLLFLVLWAAPALLFYSLIHMGQQGLVFVFLPALLLLGALGVERLLAAPRARMVATALLVAAHVVVFCLVPEYPWGPGTQRLLTRETVVHVDSYYAKRFIAVREGFLPGNAIILTTNWDHVKYYLPEYTVLPFAGAQEWAAGTGRAGGNTVAGEQFLPLADQGKLTVVLFDPILAAYDDTPGLAQNYRGILEYLEIPEGMAFQYSRDSFGVVRR